MSVVLTILLIILALLAALHFWLGHGEDLSVYDHPVENGGGESFGNPAGPSTGHQGVVAAIEARRSEIESLSIGGLIRYVRRFMEEIPAGKQLKSEFVPLERDGIHGEWVLAPGADPCRRVLYLHGGAFFAGSPHSHRSMTSHFSEVTGAAVLAVDYRLQPEHRRSDGIEDCRRAYRWLLENGPDGPTTLSTLFIGGDSAGGNLALVVSAWARDEQLRMADAVVAFSPLTDCTFLAPSIRENADKDTLVKPLFGPLMKTPRFLLRWVTFLSNRRRPVDPEVSPVFGDLSGLPPTLLQVSETEMLYDDVRRYANKARAAGSPVFLQSWNGLLHVWQLFYPEVPEAGAAWKQVSAFLEAVESGTPD